MNREEAEKRLVALERQVSTNAAIEQMAMTDGWVALTELLMKKRTGLLDHIPFEEDDTKLRMAQGQVQAIDLFLKSVAGAKRVKENAVAAHAKLESALRNGGSQPPSA